MDNAVALVQAYLRVNGYFTVSEYPIVESMRRGGYRTATDVDILAFRFPHAGRLVPAPGRAGMDDEDHFAPDPVLGAPADGPDMLVGEVKEGRAVLNAAATDPTVLRVVLVRFGCCRPAEADAVVTQLVRHGVATTALGHRIRIVAFGATVDPEGAGRYATVTLGHVVNTLETYLREHWELLRHEDQKDPALGFLATLEKARRAPAR